MSNEPTLQAWRSPAVFAVAFAAVAAGFGQFGAVAALGDVAKSFGHLTSGTSIADEAGLSGAQLGTGLAILRLASLGALPLAAFADRVGRRRILIWACAAGLVATVAAAGSPGYWWFVAIFALGRPLLSASVALGQVVVAELTDSANRAKAVALVTAGYGLGSGLTAFLHSAASGALGFRGLFLLALVPLLCLGVVARRVPETERFLLQAGASHTTERLGRVRRSLRGRLALVMALAFGVALTSGPATGFVYIDAQNIAKLPSIAVSSMVVAAGVLGVVGLVAGQRAADAFGRRPTGIASMIAIALASMITYSGSRPAIVVGYVFGVFCASLLAPTAGAFVNELFPTDVRAAVSGWLVVASVLGAVIGLVCFGAIADATGSLALAGVATFAPTAFVGLLFVRLPETKGLEPEAPQLQADGS